MNNATTTNNAFSFIAASVSQAVSINSIEDEVASLVDVARQAVGIFEAMDEFLANNLNGLPSIVEGDVIVHFVDSRKFHQYKSKSLSECLWVSAMKQLQYHGAVNYELLTTAFANWINSSVYQAVETLGRTEYARVTVTREQMLPLAKAAIECMQDVDFINKEVVKRTVRLENGENITAKVCVMSDALTADLNILIDELRVKASMKCRPLEFQPKDWTDSRTGIAEGAGIKLIKGKLRNKKVAPKVLSAVNKLQSVRFTVAPCMFESARDMQLNFQLYKGDAFKAQFSSKELSEEGASLYSELETLHGKEFYFPVTMDARGRMYYRGGLLSPQGVDFCKAAFQFAEFKPLGKKGFQAIMIHTANTLGCDKESLRGRKEFVRDEWSTLMSINTHMDIRREYPEADVFQALVAVKELQRLNALEGEWSEKTSNLVCHQDGTCNGLQHMAAITGDRPTAVAVNCVASTNSELPSDIYGIIATAAVKYATSPAAKAAIVKYARGMAKNPVMVTGYGAKESTIIKNVADYLQRKGGDATLAQECAEAYLEAINAEAGAVTQLTDAISKRMTFALGNGLTSATWRTADGFLATTEYLDDEANCIRVGNFFVRKRGVGKAPVDSMKTANAMAPNFVHSIDATHLRMVVNACDFDLVTVHDSIGSHPCDYFDTAEAVRETFAIVHTCYDALEDLCQSIKQPKPEFPEENDYKAEEALQSSYIFS